MRRDLDTSEVLIISYKVYMHNLLISISSFFKKETCKDEALFNFSGSRDQILAPNFDTVSVSNDVALMFLKEICIRLLKL